MVGGVGSFEGWTVGFWAKVGGFMRLGNFRYVVLANFLACSISRWVCSSELPSSHSTM